MTTNAETYARAMAEIDNKVTQRDCPFCENTDPIWNGLIVYAIECLVYSPDASIPDGVPDEFLSDEPDELGIKTQPIFAVAFACTNCGFIRFHRFDE